MRMWDCENCMNSERPLAVLRFHLFDSHEFQISRFAKMSKSVGEKKQESTARLWLSGMSPINRQYRWAAGISLLIQIE